jgi:competence protein ComGF
VERELLTIRKYAERLNNKGLIMIEMLLSLACLSIVAFLLAPTIAVMESSKLQASRQLQEMEWNLFLSQTKDELQASSSVQILSGKLFLKVGTNTVMYEKFGSNIRRRVNVTGHEVLLQNITSVAFKKDGQHVTIQVTDLQNNKYEGHVYSFIPWEAQQP